MQPFIWISILVLALNVVGALALVAVAMRKSSANSDIAEEKHPQGYWVSIGISIGAGFGVALGLVFDNLTLGIAIGVAIGVSVGAALQQRNKDNLRPLTERELKYPKWGVAIGLVSLLVLVGIFMFLMFLRGG